MTVLLLGPSDLGGLLLRRERVPILPPREAVLLSKLGLDRVQLAPEVARSEQCIAIDRVLKILYGMPFASAHLYVRLTEWGRQRLRVGS